MGPAFLLLRHCNVKPLVMDSHYDHRLYVPVSQNVRSQLLEFQRHQHIVDSTSASKLQENVGDTSQLNSRGSVLSYWDSNKAMSQNPVQWMLC